MRHTEVFKKAMHVIAVDDEIYSCCALGRALEGKHILYSSSPIVKRYRTVMGPHDSEVPPFTEDQALDNFTRAINDATPGYPGGGVNRKNFRLLLLAMMDAVHEDF